MAGNPMATWPAAWLEWMGGDRSAMPLGGDVTQRFAFAPLISVTGRGDPDLERQIVENVATYGAQIGQISEIVLSLVDGGDAAQLDAVKKLREIVSAIERKKAKAGKTRLARATDALDALRAHDRRAYESLVSNLRK